MPFISILVDLTSIPMASEFNSTHSIRCRPLRLWYQLKSTRPRIALCVLLVVGVCWNSVAQDTDPTGYIELEERLRIGDDENDSIIFGSIYDLSVSAFGQIYAADGTSNEIYIFSADGEHIAVIGGEGEAPGEFEWIDGIHVGPGDSVYVLDSYLYRLSVFEPKSHQFAYSFRVESHGLSDPFDLLGIVGDELLIVYSAPMSPDYGSDFEPRATVNLVNRRGTVNETPLVSLPDKKYVGGRRLILLIPFGRRFNYQLAANGMLYSGLNNEIDIQITSTDGRLQGNVRHDHTPVQVTRTDLEEYMSEMSGEARRLIEASDVPSTMPAYSTFLIDDLDRVWVRIIGKGGEPTGEWLVLANEGNLVAKAVMPLNVTLHLIQKGIAYGVGTSAAGHQYVITYEIVE